MSDGIFVKIKNTNWRPRKDIAHPTWFKCSNRILEDEDFYNFTFAEILVWIHILSVGSQQDSDEIFIKFETADRKARLTKDIVMSAVEKLKGNQIEVLRRKIRTQPVRDPYAARTEDVRDTGLDRRIEGIEGASDAIGPFLLVEIWNMETKSRPKVIDFTPRRQKKAKSFLANKSPAEWVEVCRRVEESNFLSGRNRKWTKCNFDWALNPDNFAKIMEGNYENDGDSGRASQPTDSVCGVADV